MELDRFAFSTRVYSRHTLQHALTHIADAGFKGVEILADKPHAWLDTFTATDQERLIKQLGKLKLSVSNINANCTSGFWSDAPPETLSEPSLLSRQRELREWRIAYSKKALRLGKAVGARCVSITSGRTLNGVPPEKAWLLLAEGMQRLLEYAEKISQPLALDYEPPLFIGNTDELTVLIKTLRSKYLGANLDVGHLEIAGEDPAAAIRKLKGRIFNVHLEDIGAFRHYYHLIPGEGNLNFKSIFSVLTKSGYSGPLTWELYTYDQDPDFACRKTFKYVKSLKKS